MTFYQNDAGLAEQGQAVLEAVWQAFPELPRNQLAVTWLVYQPPFPINTGGALRPQEFWQYPLAGFGYRGLECIYPASVVKLFYLVAAHEWMEAGMMPSSAELDRALEDMIVESSNDATSLVVDMLTGTTSGPELPPEPFETWKRQRNLVNRYFQSLGWSEFDAINVNQKTWGEGPYGRESAFVGPLRDNRNRLTTDAVARLLHSIVGGVAVSSLRSQTMMAHLRRSLDPHTLAQDPENQVTGFLGEPLPLDAQLWSKAGWTSTVRHDAAYIELPGRYPYILVVFTEGQTISQNLEILPFISEKFLDVIPSLETQT